MSRTIINHLRNEDYLDLCLPNPNDMLKPIPGHVRLYEALGYLASWNLNYPNVEIYRDRDCDLTAVYYNNDNERQFVMGAVWSPSEFKYSFHS
jgi:hypothetical protein